MNISIEAQNSLVRSFLKVAAGQTPHSACQFLASCNWQLEEALQLFFAGKDEPANYPPRPTRGDVYYRGGHLVRNHNNAQSSSRSRSALLFHAPQDLLYNGSFYMAMEEALKLGKMLIVNVLDSEDFESHAMNRDVWSDAILADFIRDNFLFWQVIKEEEDGKKVCMFYHLSSFPSILVIDPLTGQKKWLHSGGKVEPYALLEDLIGYTKQPTVEQHKPSTPLMESSSAEIKHPEKPKEPEIEIKYPELPKVEPEIKYPELTKVETEIKYPELPKVEPEIKYPELPVEPPDDGDKKSKLICRVWIRLPNGKRVQRRFSSSDPIQFLWSFVSSMLEGEESKKPFRFVEAVPGAVRTFKYDDECTFDKALINNVVLSLVTEN